MAVSKFYEEIKYAKVEREVEAVYKTQAYWIKPEYTKNTSVLVIDSDDVIVTHLKEILIKEVNNVMTEENIIKYMESAKENYVLGKTLLKELTLSDIKQVFANLIREKVSIKDIAFIFEKLCNYVKISKEPDILSERIRKDLSKQISLSNSKDGKIYAIKLSKELEEKLLGCLKTQEGLSEAALIVDKKQKEDLMKNLANKLFSSHEKIGNQPILLSDEKLRLALYRMLVPSFPTLVVLSKNEIESNIQLEIVDTI